MLTDQVACHADLLILLLSSCLCLCTEKSTAQRRVLVVGIRGAFPMPLQGLAPASRQFGGKHESGRTTGCFSYSKTSILGLCICVPCQYRVIGRKMTGTASSVGLTRRGFPAT